MLANNLTTDISTANMSAGQAVGMVRFNPGARHENRGLDNYGVGSCLYTKYFDKCSAADGMRFGLDVLD